jgi:phosphoserine phosphatase
MNTHTYEHTHTHACLPAALTASAMGGSLPFQDALRARLDIIRPSHAQIAACNAAHPPNLSPGIADLIQKLHDNGRGISE